MQSCLRAVAFVLLLHQPAYFFAGEKHSADLRPIAKTPQAVWAQFEKAWTPSLDPMRPLGDPVWKIQFEAVVMSAKAGKEAMPVLDNAVSNGSPAVKHWAGLVRSLLQSNAPEAAATRRALAEVDLAKIDSARYGELAPDFELADLSGKTWRLSQLKGKKDVALVFLGYNG